MSETEEEGTEGKMSMRAQTIGCMVAALLMAGTVGQAAEPQGWKVEITPYAWLAGIEGDVTVNGRKTEFDKGFSDLIDGVDMAGGLLAVVQYDRFLVWGQYDYFSTSTDNLDVEDQPQGGSMDSKMLLGEFAVGYQFDGWSEGQTFDVLVGVRALTFDNKLTVDNHGTRETEDPAEDSRVDGIIVLRPSIPVFPSKIDGLRFNPTLAIGAGDSDLVYELQPQFQYQITDSVSARLGYRTVGYKLKGEHNEDNEMNIRLAGLIAGVGVTF
jgi:hypothetical protein